MENNTDKRSSGSSLPPIDPLQLLKALAPLLSPDGGMKSPEEVSRLSSLMKKFSRKLVSRCVYVNVLRTTAPDVLDAFLKEGGWETINMWLQDSRKGDNNPFLIELLKLFKKLPMTVDRLKENNSGKLVKALTKSDSEEVRILSTEIVDSWMKLVKGESSENKEIKVPKKKMKKDHAEEHKKKPDKEIKKEKESKENTEKKKGEEKKAEKKATTKENTKAEDLEDVKLPEFLEKIHTPKKPKVDRKKTVKTYQARFRSIGLEEATPLPKPLNKKANSNVDKTAALVAKNAVKRIGSVTQNKEIQPPEKRPKPSSLIIQASENHEKPGIKLIPAKPKPVLHTIKESAGFMDALVAEPTIPVRRKKKAPKAQSPTTPPSPTTTTPKLQFYKDTMETQSEGEGRSNETDDLSPVPNEDSTLDSSNENRIKTEPNLENESPTALGDSKDASANETSDSSLAPLDGKRKKRKKVSWAEESNLRQVFYFELDETERVNVNNIKNFGDLKTLERLKERQVVESARRSMMGDRMEEQAMWMPLMLIDLPQPLIEPGCSSEQRAIQHAREQSILQEIYFTKESVPDSPHEPDPEMYEPTEPKLIPLEDENNPDSIMDYSNVEPPAPITTLPPALSNLMMSIGAKPVNNFQPDVDMRYGEESPMQQPYPPSDMGMPMNANLLPPGPMGYEPPYGKFVPGGSPEGVPPGMPMNPMGVGVPEGEYFEGGPPPMGPPHPHQAPRMRPPMRGRGCGMGPPRGRPMHRGPSRGNRGSGKGNMRARGRAVCRHFAAGGCRFEDACKFLHPGVNGPLL